MRWGQENKVLPKPEGFDAKACMGKGSFSGGAAYEYEFYVMYKNIDNEIRGGRRDIKRLTERLANWKTV